MYRSGDPANQNRSGCSCSCSWQLALQLQLPAAAASSGNCSRQMQLTAASCTCRFAHVSKTDCGESSLSHTADRHTESTWLTFMHAHSEVPGLRAPHTGHSSRATRFSTHRGNEWHYAQHNRTIRPLHGESITGTRKHTKYTLGLAEVHCNSASVSCAFVKLEFLRRQKNYKKSRTTKSFTVPHPLVCELRYRFNLVVREVRDEG